MAYKAIVARIHTRPLPGSDNIVLGTVGAYQVIVNKDTPDASLGVFFETGGQLSEEFARVNDLVSRRNPDSSRAGGFFEETRRVKSLKLRGARSEGFFCPLEHFAYTGYDLSQLREGDQFDALNGHAICTKYITKATRAARGRWSSGGSRNTHRGETPMFVKHIETEQFKRAINMIPPGAVIYLSEKLHGTSFRYGLVLEDYRAEGFVEKLIHWLTAVLKFPLDWREWNYLNGSRNVIIERREGGGFHGKEDFRLSSTSQIRLHKGEVLFGELVGYTETGAPIMSPQNAAGLKDKKIKQAFGDEIVYRYGTIPGQTRLFVYRITQVNEDGHSTELSFPQMVRRCKELGLEPVPCFAAFVYDGNAEALARQVALLTDGESGSDALPSGVDPSHIQEGIVLRYESEHGIGWLKNKSFVFGCLEGYLKEREDYVDTEEAA